MQHTLPHGMVLDTEYIGTKGTHLGILENPNRSVSSIANSALQINNATSFSYQTQGANSTTTPAQVRLTRRLSRQRLGEHAVHVRQGDRRRVELQRHGRHGGAVPGQPRTGARAFHLRPAAQSERTASSFPRRWGSTACCATAAGRRKLLRGWNMNGNFNATTGTPLTAKVSGNLANTGGLAGGGSLRAEATGLPIEGPGDTYFNPLAFTTPLAGQFGNAGRNTIPGLFRITVNSSLNRSFRFGESRRTLTFSPERAPTRSIT